MTMMSQCIISLGRVLNFVRHSFNELFLYHIWIRGGWIRWGGYEGGGFRGGFEGVDSGGGGWIRG